MSAHVWESAVLPYPIGAVWNLVKNVDFAYQTLRVTSSTIDEKANWDDVGAERTIVYRDKEKTTQKLKLTERSDLHTTVAWDLTASTPDHHVGASSYRVELRRISTNNHTFIEWTADFSKDASSAVLIDAKYKAKDHFKDLAKALRGVALTEGRKTHDTPSLVRQVSQKTDTLQKLFKQLDKNGNNVLEPEEFYAAVNQLFGKSLPKSALEILLLEADQDANGTIDYTEFVAFLDKNKTEEKKQ